MTLTHISLEQLPPASFFLDTVCPGVDFLDDNIHFSLRDVLSEKNLATVSGLNWPLTGSTTATAAVKAHLDLEYLNVARPPFQHDVHKNIESTTYVSLPFHISSILAEVVSDKGQHKQDGAMHVGANVNPLMHDPFRLVLLNPGCISSMLVLDNLSRNSSAENPRNTFNKMTTSINRFLRGGNTTEVQHFASLLDAIEPIHISLPQGDTSPKKARVFAKILDFDAKSYFARLRSPATAKLLVSVNINVVNVMAINENFEYGGTSETTSTAAFCPLTDPAASEPALTTTCEPYKKFIEVPLLRLQLHPCLMATSLLTLTAPEPTVVLGLNTGDIVVINLGSMTYRVFESAENSGTDGNNVGVSSLCAISHPSYELLLVAGYANGEVVILDPFGEPAKTPYNKSVVGKDNFVTFFKKFDLSPLHKREPRPQETPGFLVGHFKLSHKAITSIASTLPCNHDYRQHNPMIIAVASDDGLVRFLDLINTHGKNYGDPLNFYNALIVSDIVLNYFQDGVRHIEFSPDFRFFCMGGKGDLIEVFKMAYYNVNGLLLKNKGRSRSGTVNSASSGNFHGSYLSASNSLDIPRDEHDHYPPMIKDITIVSRLKGHTNTVEKVSFVRNDELSKGGMEEDGNRAYKLISCGSDGKVILWDFDSKALPRIKKSHIVTSKRKRHLVVHAEPVSTRKGVPTIMPVASTSLSPMGLSPKHTRPRSWMHQEETALTSSFSNLGINTLLSPSPQALTHLDNAEEQQKIVFLLYRSLYDVRLKKHYSKITQSKECKKKYTSIIHGIVNDKELPSILIPLLNIDMSCLAKDGKIQGFHVNPFNFWVFGRNGDIFKYNLEG